MAGYVYRGTVFDGGGRSSGRKPIEHGTTVGNSSRCFQRELGACDECKRVRASYEARRRALADPRNTILLALRALVEAS
jgi:hypothetical protein